MDHHWNMWHLLLGAGWVHQEFEWLHQSPFIHFFLHRPGSPQFTKSESNPWGVKGVGFQDSSKPSQLGSNMFRNVWHVF